MTDSMKSLAEHWAFLEDELEKFQKIVAELECMELTPAPVKGDLDEEITPTNSAPSETTLLINMPMNIEFSNKIADVSSQDTTDGGVNDDSKAESFSSSVAVDSTPNSPTGWITVKSNPNSPTGPISNQSTPSNPSVDSNPSSPRVHFDSSPALSPTEKSQEEKTGTKPKPIINRKTKPVLQNKPPTTLV